MTTALVWPDKHPDEVFRNGVDWTAVIGSSEISAVDAEVEMGDVVVVSPSETVFVEAIQSVWVSGGTPGRQKVMVTATLSDGQVLQQRFQFSVRL